MNRFDYATLQKQECYETHRVASFMRTREAYGALSNMAHFMPFEAGGIQWPTSEHLYQALRFPDHPEIQRAILSARSAKDAKGVAHAQEHIGHTRSDWNHVRVHAMAYTITRKLLGAQSNMEFENTLIATGRKEIVETSYRDRFWGATPTMARDGTPLLIGQNVLGKLLTQLRDGARETRPPEGTRLLGIDIMQNRTGMAAPNPMPRLVSSHTPHVKDPEAIKPAARPNAFLEAMRAAQQNRSR